MAAAHRELLEETGLTAELKARGVLGAVGSGVLFHVFAGRTTATQQDVVLGEGLAMVFLTQAEIAALPLASNVARFLELSLES